MSEPTQDPPGPSDGPVDSAEAVQARALALATAQATDAEILSALRHEVRGTGYRPPNMRRVVNRLIEQGRLEDARTHGRLKLTECLRDHANGGGNSAVSAAIYLGKREDPSEGMDPELRRLLKDLQGMGPEELRAFAEQALKGATG